MSDVERFYEASRKHFPNSKPWKSLPPQAQIQFVQGINALLEILTYNG